MTFCLQRREFLTGAGLALALPTPATAHGFHASFSVIEFNPRTQSLEIFHRIFIQDIEILLTARAGEAVTLHDAPATAKLVESYLLGVFSVKTPDGKALKPEWVGLKLQVDTMFVYQEIKRMGELKGLVISDQILTETHPGQVNTVNITMNGRTQSLIFTAADSAQSVTFAG